MASFRPLAVRSSRLRPLLQSRLELSSPSVRPSVPVLCSGARCLLSTFQLPSQLAHSLRRYSSKRPAASEDYDIEEEEVVSKTPGATDGAPTPSPPPPSAYPAVIYVGPVSKAFRFLKGFSLTSLAISTSLSPFIFILDAPLGMAGRVFLAGCAISTTVLSTAMISWCSAPYVSTIEILEPPTEDFPNPAIRLLTYTPLLQPRYTTLTTPLFIHEATRPLSTWQLAPLSTPPSQAYPDIVAQTEDKHGKVLGRWDGEQEEGKVIKTFMVHEDLLEGIWGLDGWRSHKTSDIS